MFDDPVTIDRMGDGPANLGIVQRLISRTQNEKNRTQALYRLNAQTRVRLEPLHFVGRQVADDICLTRFKRCNPRGVLLDALVNDFVDFWWPAPIIFVAPANKQARAVPTHEFKRTRPNG